VTTLNNMVRRYTDLGPVDVEWLQTLVGDWQLLSDLSFADLVLWVTERDSSGWIAVAHVRPSTSATVYHDDIVGARLPRGRRPQLDRAHDLARICRERDPEWRDDVPVREETIPVVRDGTVIAVISRHTNLAAARTPSRLELTYRQCADDLTSMIAAGDFPTTGGATGSRRGTPRVGDGLMRLDADGCVVYASPNAVSAIHRLGFVGSVVGQSLAGIVTPLLDPGVPMDEGLLPILRGRAAQWLDFEVRGITLSVRSIPLRIEGERVGALLLSRDVSDLRRRERELLTKDATIREVHHRVKNNLQTVTALLRLQARRIPSDEGRIALMEAMRRVATIAMVHETLSTGLGETVVFDEVVDRTVTLAVELTGRAGVVRVRREGVFGELRAENATPLALVLTELVTNAVTHGLGAEGGTVRIIAEREDELLRTTVRDDGKGLPDGFVAGVDGLGTQIVQALIAGDMRGRIQWQNPPDGGTEVVVDVVLRPLDRSPASEGPTRTPDLTVDDGFGTPTRTGSWK
jgi:two-component sensor histidine kinase